MLLNPAESSIGEVCWYRYIISCECWRRNVIRAGGMYLQGWVMQRQCWRVGGKHGGDVLVNVFEVEGLT